MVIKADDSQKDMLRHVKAKISGLKRGRRFIDWRESREFTRELYGLLEDLRDCVRDGKAGLQLTEAFYLTDEAVIGRCDDSDGNIGDVYRLDARDLFKEYGMLCEDKELVSDTIFRLNLHDEYGVRDSLIGIAGELLDEPQIRRLIDRYTELMAGAASDFERRHALYSIESLARQIGDAELFERTLLMESEKTWPAQWIKIAQVYLAAGDADTAYERLQRIPEDDRMSGGEKNSLLLEIYRQQGLEDKRTELLFEMFRANHTASLLNSLVEAVGEDRREELIDGAVSEIRRFVGISYSDLNFLIDCGRYGDAEAYLVSRADRLNGGLYTNLLPVAAALEKHGFVTGTTLIYRALLLSILEKAYTKAYSHGVRYLKKLDRLALEDGDWKRIGEHRLFVEELVRKHGRKASFWTKYESAK